MSEKSEISKLAVLTNLLMNGYAEDSDKVKKVFKQILDSDTRKIAKDLIDGKITPTTQVLRKTYCNGEICEL